eukprot:TRINITY_DN1027_c0_g1_i2.p1 TRINITY_DN1027_c0_g1~~TRINITY_DN1027_c0_g1_i2.p1  ORF type:complete len:963 (-),score=-41.55 TRINITY_DN1027_c0_g1_i2:70-2958(-)
MKNLFGKKTLGTKLMAIALTLLISLPSASLLSPSFKAQDVKEGEKTIKSVRMYGEIEYTRQVKAIPVDDTGEDIADDNSHITYEWIIDGETIRKDKNNILEFTSPEHIGKTLKIKASVEDVPGEFNASEGTSDEQTIAKVKMSRYKPVMIGEAMVGNTLTVTRGTVPVEANITYEWQASGTSGIGTIGSGEELTVTSEHKANYQRIWVVAKADNSDAVHTGTSGQSNSSFITESNKVTGTATINGLSTQIAPVVGEELVADVKDLDPASAASLLTYKWIVGTEEKSTEKTYTVVAEDLGKTIQLQVGLSDATKDNQIIQAPTTSVVTNTIANCTPEILGDVKVGSTITAGRGDIPADAEVEYKWSVGSAVIEGESVTLTAADINKLVALQATAKAGSHYTGSTRIVTSYVGKADLTGVVTINGTSNVLQPKVGDTLTAGVEFLNPAGTGIEYKWIVGGETKSTNIKYTVDMADKGKTITLEVYPVEADAYNNALTQAPATEPVTDPKDLSNYTPTYTGEVKCYEILTANRGDIPADANIKYEWLIDGVVDKTEDTFNVVNHIGKKLQLRATVDGSTQDYYGTTKLTVEKEVQKNILTGKVLINGTDAKITPIVGEPLSVNIEDQKPSGFVGKLVYAWKVGGETKTTNDTGVYTPAAEDAGKPIEVKVDLYRAPWPHIDNNLTQASATNNVVDPHNMLNYAATIEGDAKVGQTITAGRGDIPAEIPDETITYTWTIDGETHEGKTLELTPDNYSANGVSLTATTTHAPYFGTTSAVHKDIAQTTVTGKVTINGLHDTPVDPKVGEDLTADVVDLNPDFASNHLSYSWQDADTSEELGTDYNLSVTEGMLGKNIKLIVSVQNPAFISNLTQAQTTNVVRGELTGDVTINSKTSAVTPYVGSNLEANVDGLSPKSAESYLTYTWVEQGTEDVLDTGKTLEVTEAMLGKQIAVSYTHLTLPTKRIV